MNPPCGSPVGRFLLPGAVLVFAVFFVIFPRFWLVFVWLSCLLMIFHNESSYSRKSKVRHRLSDGIFMAIFLRFLAAVLKTLTASYSSDTVHALAISSLFLHLIACDYSYANGLCGDTASDGDSKRRPTFQKKT